MLILLLMIVGLAVVGIQNWLPVLPLVIFGYATPAFPLALWMAGAIAAGLLTSTILQLLNFRPTPPSRQSREPEPQRKTPQTRTIPASDWETPATEEDWGTKATPPPPKSPKPNLEKEPRTYEAVQPPQSDEKKEETRDRVYDANYRVLNTPNPQPPEQPSTPNSEQEEDWGFDDDEFESEYRQQWRDRE